MITALMVMMLISAILVGMCWMVMTDVRLGGNNKGRETAFYGAEAGMEKLTTDVALKFATKGALTPADITAITAAPPLTIPGIQYVNPAGASTYQISPLVPVSSNATILPPSPYAGMQALITPFTLTVAAQNVATGAEVKLSRQIQMVNIPVFQFGIYSDSDLQFTNGPKFQFGGRTHTNGNLWLGPDDGPLFMGDKVTVVGQVIRTNMENGIAAVQGGTFGGNVSIALSPNPTLTNEPGAAPYTNASWRELAFTEGSVQCCSVYGAISTTLNNPTWSGTVIPAYNGQLQNGVPVLSLTSTSLGGITTPISLIRRAVPGELAANPAEFSQQPFSEATLRIMLDDYPVGVLPGAASACHNVDMMGLDGVDTTVDPVDLATLTNVAPNPATPTWWVANGGAVPYLPLPASNGPAAGNYTVYNSTTGGVGTGYWQTQNSPIITGCIKIEYQDTGLVFHDITKKILAMGFTGKNINPTNPTGTYPNLTALVPGSEVGAQNAAAFPCADPSLGAIIRLTRVRDNPSGAGSPYCGTPNDTLAYDYWPLTLFDSREGELRPADTLANSPKEALPQIEAIGVMNYVELDAANLANWLRNNQAGLGLNNNGGFLFYFSDRRGEQLDNTLATPARTGSFGFNDIVNGADAANGCPNGALDAGEDLEGDGTLRTYGHTATSIYNALGNVNLVAGQLNTTGASYPILQNPNCASYNTPWPGVTYAHVQEARENPPLFFRRALKVVNGSTLNLGTSCYGAGATNPPCGLTIAAENPVYVQGDYNAPGGVLTAPCYGAGDGPAASIAGDAVTLLSDNWNDVNTFANPYTDGKRAATQTSYRMAVIGGKGIPFPQPAGEPNDFGQDGGVHNFLRFLENWGGINANYKGSLVSFFYNRQAVGTFKNDNDSAVYAAPVRNYNFDLNFTLGPSCLPPQTPQLKSVNTIGFSQELLPTQ
jgi:hypothetical protein